MKSIKKSLSLCLLFLELMIMSACSVGTHSNATENIAPTPDAEQENLEQENLEQENNQNLTETSSHIVIDPGHGGFDPGKVSADGIIEKDINLQIALKLKEELENQGITVTMTRETDMGLYEESSKAKKSEDMRNRCKLIEEIAPVCTIGIHQNSFTDSSVYGPQVFYHKTSEEGKELAGILQKHLNEKLSIEKPREIKEDGAYYILKRSTSVTVLVECGFLSNPQEAQKLIKEDYQKQIASAICEGVLEYMSD